MEKFSVSLYICGCGYKTTSPGNATKHRKVSCGHAISVSTVSMVLEKDHLSAIEKASTGGITTTGDNNSPVLSSKETRKSLKNYRMGPNV